MAAIVFQEPGFERVAARLEAGTVFAPELLKFELINTAWKKARRHPSEAAKYLAALAIVLDGAWDIVWHDVEAVDVAFVALATGLTAYDASYLWLAGRLGAELVTLDGPLSKFDGLI